MTMTTTESDSIERLKTHIHGFDSIAKGGLPAGRTTLVAGSAGSAKTVFAAQFLAEGIQTGEENGVFVTFEETPEDLRRNMKGFGWEVDRWERAGRWVFVDASPTPDETTHVSGEYDLGALLARIEHAVQKSGARRVSLDSISAIFNQFSDATLVRSEFFRIAVMLKRLGVTTLMTAERLKEYGDIARYGVEEFVTDNVIILRNVLEDEKRRRTIEILKFRGTWHQKGEYPFTILPGQGIVVIPLSALELKQASSDIRVTSGNPEMDRICGGGYFRDSVVLVSGATGTGKTLTTTHFIAGGASNNERCLLYSFEESRDQLTRNATGWGVDFEKMEREGTLKVVCLYPEVIGLEDHLIKMKSMVDEFRPNRVAVDSLSALERAGTSKGFREFVIGMTSFIKHAEVLGLFTSRAPMLTGSPSVTEAHISTIADTIILLRYVEIFGEMRRGITVLKMRGSMHQKDIFEFTIDSKGMHVGRPFRNVTGILTGSLGYMPPDELERMSDLFKEDRLLTSETDDDF